MFTSDQTGVFYQKYVDKQIACICKITYFP